MEDFLTGDKCQEQAGPLPLMRGEAGWSSHTGRQELGKQHRLWVTVDKLHVWICTRIATSVLAPLWVVPVGLSQFKFWISNTKNMPQTKDFEDRYIWEIFSMYYQCSSILGPNILSFCTLLTMLFWIFFPNCSLKSTCWDQMSSAIFQTSPPFIGGAGV